MIRTTAIKGFGNTAVTNKTGIYLNLGEYPKEYLDILTREMQLKFGNNVIVNNFYQPKLQIIPLSRNVKKLIVITDMTMYTPHIYSITSENTIDVRELYPMVNPETPDMEVVYVTTEERFNSLLDIISDILEKKEEVSSVST